MEKELKRGMSRRDFMRITGLATLTMGASASLFGFPAALQAKSSKTVRPASAGPYNILMIVTDQEQYMTADQLPNEFSLPGHERLAKRGIVFENHQIASNVCTPSRAVLYTGQHIQNCRMFDNADFPWCDDLSTDIDTIGDLLRKEGYYTAYKGKWHLNNDFETINKLHAPKKLLVDEMEAYGFSDYFGIGDIIAHTEGGYLHDDVITAMSRSWLRGQGERLRQEKKPWFLAVNLVNPHDVMYYNTDLSGEAVQSGRTMMRLNREPAHPMYHAQWDVKLPKSRNQSIREKGRPTAHYDYVQSRGALVGIVPNEDARWRRLNNYYLNCIRDVDRHLVELLDELDNLGMSEDTIVIYTADHGELVGAHGMSGKGATAYREQNNVPFMIAHPAFPGNKSCKAVTSHVDMATTLVSIARGKTSEVKGLPGKDITAVLVSPEAAAVDALRAGALYNFNMFAYVDAAFLNSIAKFFAEGGKPQDLPAQGFQPNLKKRGAIRSIYDGRYKFNRYFAPLEHHMPRTMEQLFANNDVEFFDLKNDPLEMKNLAVDRKKYGDLILAMNNKLNLLIEQEVGDDPGQMLPGGADAKWRLSPELKYLRM
jgi:arylsulfatase